MGTINYSHDSKMHNPKDALEILPIIFKIVNPKSVLDIGCGNGSWLNAAKKLGVDIIQGVDGIQVEDKDMLVNKDEFLKHDLTKPLSLNKKYDIAISLEVAEHLPEAASETIIETLCNHSDIVLFSAAIPNQGGQFHINEQWPEYWNDIFKSNGFIAYDIIRSKIWNNSNIFWWYKQNTLLFIKKNHHLTELLGNSNNNINALIHPQLYGRKMDRPKYLNRNELFNLLKHTVKLILKSYK